MPKEKFTPAVRGTNRALERLFQEFKRVRGICQKHGNPLRYITYRVFDNGETKCHVAYKKK
jgi:hypothetical protein